MNAFRVVISILISQGNDIVYQVDIVAENTNGIKIAFITPNLSLGDNKYCEKQTKIW